VPDAHPAVVTTAEGTWTPLTNQAPAPVGLMMLLTDGTVIASDQSVSNAWYKLTPDSQGHYANGTWTTITPMQYQRLFVLSQVQQSGKVFIAGGEYGNAPNGSGEIYDPIANTWSATANPSNLDSSGTLNYVDGESMLLPNGNILAYSVVGQNCEGGGFYIGDLLIYNVAANTFSSTGCPIGNQDETSWVKLPDGSILSLDFDGSGNSTRASERYFPSTGQWVADAVPPVYMFSPGGELGGAFLLPNGKVFYIGGINQTLLYTPSGSNGPGTWTLGPAVPNEGGVAMGAQDAPAAEMIDGNILMAEGCFSDACNYGAPTYLFYYDYKANTLTNIAAPDGTSSVNVGPYTTGMLDLPDGTVLFQPASTQLYTFTPANAQVSAGAPVISSVAKNQDGSYLLTGTGFNSISMGADYGDEDQNATNYPIAILTASNGNVYYGRTTNWNLTGVATGSTATTTDMTVPTGLPAGTYQLSVSANGIQSAPVTFSYSTAAPAVTLSTTSLSFSSTQVGSTSTMPVTITNSGTATLNVSAISQTGANASLFSHTSNCGGNPLAPGASCTVQVTFAPTASGSFSATMNITDNAGNSPQSVALSGTATTSGAAVTLSPTSLSFSSTQLGSTTTLPLTITNSGTATLNVSAISQTGTSASLFSHTSNCGGNPIAPGKSCTAQVTFTPTAAGSFSATLNVTDNAGNSPQTVALTGTAVAGPIAKLSATSLSFPSTQVGSTSTLPVTITNSGSGMLHIVVISSTGTNASLFTHTSTCGGSELTNGQSCSAQIIFTPTAAGSFSATLSITDNAANSPQTVTLTGTATAGPVAHLSATSLSFPSTAAGSTSTLPLTISNSGSGMLHIVVISSTGTNASLFTHTSTCGGSELTNGQSCSAQVIFAPTAAGSFTATLNITDNANGSPQTVTLTGTGH
jgi:hypothetical protein